jgi:ActR/RegA family two-component response regulator
MTRRQNGERTRVMIVEQDLDFGLKLADWLATHGYQPVFVRTVDAAVDELAQRVPAYSWAQVFAAVDRLSRQGTLTVSRASRFGYVLSVGSDPSLTTLRKAGVG